MNQLIRAFPPGLIAILVVASHRAEAVSESAASPLFLDASVPSAGRGGASTAVFWDEGPNHWANPALAAFHRGVRYERNDTQFVPDLTEDVFHRTRRWSFGAYGIGLVTAGRPIDGLGYQELSYGESQATDASGNVIATFESYEEIELFGVGMSAAELLTSFAPQVALGGHPLARYADVAAGFATKRVKSFLSPQIGNLAEAYGETTVNDWGILVRVTPLDTMNYPGSSPAIGDAVPLRLDASFGHAMLNYDDATLQYVENGAVNPIARMPRTGWSVHAAVGLPVAVRDGLRSRGASWLTELVDPIVRIGFGWDTSHFEIPQEIADEFGSSAKSSDIQEKGWELTIANIFTVRRGRTDDPVALVDDDADGWGVGLRFGRFAGFRYDQATVPQAVGLDPLERKGWSAFVDPIAIWGTRRGHPGPR